MCPKSEIQLTGIRAIAATEDGTRPRTVPCQSFNGIRRNFSTFVPAARVDMPASETSRLPAEPVLPQGLQARVQRDWERFASDGLPDSIEDHLLDEYGLDVATEYAGVPIRNPWGKASGQLSMNANQVREDVEAGLGFVVLKTVIAEDADGDQSMKAWAIKEARMVAETIAGASGETGWTITWKGRGWWQSFDEYLALIRDARRIAADTGTLIVPSCKYHLPSPGETEWRTSEYEYTTSRILEAWHIAGDEPTGASRRQTNTSVMPLEKDFSPTLAGSDLAAVQECIRNWLREVPQLIRAGAESSPHRDSLRVGLKVFNAMFDDAFQVELLRLIHGATDTHRPDFFIYGNRLFDPNREFDGHRGVAYGGPDLSDRNLRVMSAFNASDTAAAIPWSATGDITTGKMAVEYALRGATSFQLHTFFQLPADQYLMKTGSRTQRALNELYFHPETGFVVWMEHLRQTEQLPSVISLTDITCNSNRSHR